MNDIFKIGDRVFDYAYGWGTVTNISTHTFIDYKVAVKFDAGNEHHYTLDGRAKMGGNKVLSFDSYDITKPINHLPGIERMIYNDTEKFVKQKLESAGVDFKTIQFKLEVKQ